MVRGHHRRCAVRTVLAACLGVSLVGAFTPASAATGDGAIPDAIDGVPFERYIQTHDHTLGSQIRQTEGASDMAKKHEPTAAKKRSGVAGIDVSSHQGELDWSHWRDEGKRFAYIKATEGTYYQSPRHPGQYANAHAAGLLRGSYHFAVPNDSGGAEQANFFVDHGGGWTPDGKTLPGALDMEYNPYGDTCYGLSKDEMASWIGHFSDTYHARTGRYPVIYTSASWWNQCVSADFSAKNPLWVARYDSAPGELPYDWTYHTFWQYSSDPIDQNVFNASYAQLVDLAAG